MKKQFKEYIQRNHLHLSIIKQATTQRHVYYAIKVTENKDTYTIGQYETKKQALVKMNEMIKGY